MNVCRTISTLFTLGTFDTNVYSARGCTTSIVGRAIAKSTPTKVPYLTATYPVVIALFVVINTTFADIALAFVCFQKWHFHFVI